MSTVPSSRARGNVLQPGAWLVVASLVLSGCAASGPAASSATEASVPASASAEPTISPSASAEPVASAAPSEAAEAPCLPPDLFAALEAIESVEVGPDLPATELADAVESLDLSAFDERTQVMQDDLVALLRAGDASSFDAQVAAGVLRQSTDMAAC